MMPLVLVGSFVGVLVNIMLPPVLLSLFLTVILLGLTAQSYFKGKQMFNKETFEIQRLQIVEQQRRKNIELNDLSPPGTSVEKYENL